MNARPLTRFHVITAMIRIRLFFFMTILTALAGCADKSLDPYNSHGAPVKTLRSWEQSRTRSLSPPLRDDDGVVIIQTAEQWNRLWTYVMRLPGEATPETVVEAPDVDFAVTTALAHYNFNAQTQVTLRRVELNYDAVTMRLEETVVEEAAQTDSDWYDLQIVLVEKLPDTATAKAVRETVKK